MQGSARKDVVFGAARVYTVAVPGSKWKILVKEGKQATHWTRLSCHRFRANEVRLQLSVLAYNLGNLWRRLGLPHRIKSWSLTSLQHRLMKTGGRLVKHARYYWLLLAEGHLNRRLFGDMLHRIWALPLPERVERSLASAKSGCCGVKLGGVPEKPPSDRRIVPFGERKGLVEALRSGPVRACGQERLAFKREGT